MNDSSYFTKRSSYKIFIKDVKIIFLTGEMVQNASGFGFHYVNGNPEWNLTTNTNMSACRVMYYNYRID